MLRKGRCKGKSHRKNEALVVIEIEKVQLPPHTKSGTLIDLSYEEIEYILGEPNLTDSYEESAKIRHSWGFMATAENGTAYGCGIWSFMDSHKEGKWSYCGPKFVYDILFGNHHIQPMKAK